MKLVEILAKALSEWPESAVCITQDDSSHLYGWIEMRPECRGGAWYSPDGKDFGMHDPGEQEEIALASDQKKSIVTKAQWQAERDRQKGGEWKRHRGNSQPVDEGTWVEVKLRCGDIQQGLANEFLWRHADCDVAVNIMKFRVISQPQAEEVKLIRLEARMLFSEPCIVYPESAEAKTDQIDGPLRWRDCVNELDAYIEKYTRERDALIERLASEGFALIPKVVSVVSEFSGADMSDWRNWKAGDSVTYIHTSTSSFTDGWQYTLEEVDEDRVSIERDDEGDANGWLTRYFKWHSRP